MAVVSREAATETVRVIPVKHRVRDDDARVDVLRGIGFRAVSNQGWRGPYRRTRPEAVTDAQERRQRSTPRHRRLEDAQTTERAEASGGSR